jgi:mRNA-degrading endonuclease toxin of MazEF toxin-antitoxin module
MLIEPTDRNGLSSASRLMIDRITTVPKARLGKRIGKLNDEDVVRSEPRADSIPRACPMTDTQGPNRK